ncbi:MAG: hypothetical protein LLG04_04730, partial [Parachlamydia sp.]|nr:hypothetical protein [Parachlamydia sp.]
PELGLNVALLGGIFGGIGFYFLYKGNPLEKALIHLIGSQEKLERLPEVKRTKIDIHPRQGNAVNYFERKEVLGIEPDAMTSNMMRVTEKGKTIGVAFKYLTALAGDNHASDEKTEIRVYFFQQPAEFKLVKIRDAEGSYKSKDKMTALEGKALEAMIKNGNFRYA